MSPTVIQFMLKNGQPTSHGLMMNPSPTAIATAMAKMTATATPDKLSNMLSQQQSDHHFHPKSHLLGSIQKPQSLHSMAVTQKHTSLHSRMKLPCYIKRTLNLLPMLPWPLITYKGSNAA